MPSDIYFAVENVHVRVNEDPGEVAEAFRAAGGTPCRLTDLDGLGEVYVNAATVAFWTASEPGREPASTWEPAKSTEERDVVTDIWGRPVHKRPRR